ncbi:hypothetical protein L218DRAFT_836741, partial [Marasmius fiardii PR-910]
LTGIVGGVLRIACYRYLGNAFTYNITKSSPKLVTSGPYSFVRHPGYLASWLTNIGLTLYHLSPGSWLRESGVLNNDACKVALGMWIFFRLLVTNIGMTLRTEEEDRLMESKFGKEWEVWRESVRYRIFPGLY